MIFAFFVGMKHVYLYDPIYHAILNLNTHIYTMIKSLHYCQCLSILTIYKITKDYLFFTRKVIENFFKFFFLYTSIVEDERSESECFYYKLRCQLVKLNLIEILEKTNNELHRILCGNATSLVLIIDVSHAGGNLGAILVHLS